MAKRQIFYSFHYDKDVFRVQQIRNMGVLEGDEPVSPNEWETLKKGGDKAIEKWIDENMKYKSCVVVLVGEETHKRPWIKYEIKKAWESGKGLVGIYIHNLKDPRTGKCSMGANPFAHVYIGNETLLNKASCYNPDSSDTYTDIKNNLEKWIEKAIKDRQ